MIRFALIGAGFIGSVHARNLAAHPGVKFALVHDIDPSRAANVAERHGAQVAPDLDTVFTSREIDAVFIASSTNTHADYLQRAARAGKAVLCEKPIDLAIDRARSAVAAVQDAGVPAMISFNRRFDASHAALHASVAGGEAGTIELVQMTSREPTVPPLDYIKVSGGQLRDQTIHFFDLLRWITQDDPVEVHVMGAVLADPRVAEVGDVDTSVALLRLRSGALCQIDSARRTGYGYDERIEVFGSKGMVESRRQRYRGVSRFNCCGTICMRARSTSCQGPTTPLLIPRQTCCFETTNRTDPGPMRAYQVCTRLGWSGTVCWEAGAPRADCDTGGEALIGW